MQPLQSVPGMNDVLPADAPRWQAMEREFRAMCERYGFGEVRTPVCEYTELFVRSVGETSDVVEKEMYTLTDRGGRSLTLRPEGTAGAVRAYLNSIAGSEPIARWFYVGAMFRGERPAKGRTRQFQQLGVEVYGDPGPAVDAEVIEMGCAFFRTMGIEKVEVRLNSIGAGDTRARYRQALIDYFTPLKDKLSEDSQRRLNTNPLRIIDSKAAADIALREGAPKPIDYLSDADRRGLDAIQAMLARLGTPCVLDPTIVRGLDYYTGVVFEYKDTSGALGAQDTLGAGGRYDNLVAELGGKPTPAVGWALGCERILLAAREANVARVPSAMVIGLARAEEVNVQAEALAIARELREAGIVTYIDTRFGKADRQFRLAEKLGARAGIVVGSAEVTAGTVNLKDLAAKAQTTVARKDLVREVQSLLARGTRG